MLEADRDWDYEFLERILAFKLKRMAKVIGEDERIICNKRIGRSINYAIYLLDRIHNRVDETKFNDEFHEKWGAIKFEFEKMSDNNRYSLMKTTYSKVKTPEEHEQAEEDSMLCHQKCMDKLDDLYERLFRHIGKNIRRWWS